MACTIRVLIMIVTKKSLQALIYYIFTKKSFTKNTCAYNDFY